MIKAGGKLYNIPIYILFFAIVILITKTAFYSNGGTWQNGLYNNSDYFRNNNYSLTDIAYTPADDIDKYLWDITVKNYLRYDLWSERDLYDAGHALMIPLHAAFSLNESAWQNDFYNHFMKLTDYLKDNDDPLTDNRLSNLQYLYLVS